MASVVFAPGRVVPFHSEPGTRGACDLTDEPHGAEGSIVGDALPNSVGG